ncbi:hybrid sensor histidine kinase/response regulator [Roseibacillus persicicus]|uniref:hybrid sensor histidine kinase/response regulator n=1 Tax=Roseibacillus persicicus TaxID=454148 RepID=UPI001674CB37|nr:ATP-binding protein [Roseibacillus persicicus]
MTRKAPVPAIDTYAVFRRSPIPQALVDKKTHRVIECSEAFRAFLSNNDCEAEWWDRLVWGHEECYRLIQEQGRNEDLRIIESLTLTLECGSKQSFQLAVTDLDDLRLLTFTARNYTENDTDLLEQAFQGTEFRVGRSYFRYCTEAFCKTFGMDYGLIARLDDSGKEPMAHSISFYNSRDGYIQNIRYSLLNTPCILPYQKPGVSFVPDNLQKVFPMDLDLIAMEAQSYIGLPILDENGKAIGHLALLHSKPIPEPTHTEKMFLKIFAARSGAELQRQRVEEELRRSQKKAEEGNQAKTRFLANMSHELRSPLNAVLGYSQLLGQSTALSETDRGRVENINRNGRHLLALINDVLDMSRIELKHLDIENSPVRLADIHQDVQALIFPPSNDSETTFLTSFAPDLPDTVLTDGAKVRQILTNLVTNSIKYGNGSEIKFQVSIDSNDDPQLSTLHFTVSDEGPGIPKKVHERLFYPFERGKHRLNSNIDGTGLGLSIARRLARAMGGDITLVSEEGQGSAFTLSLPVAIATEETPLVSCPTRSLEKTSLQGCVLVVDDNDASRDIVRQVLEREGLSVIEACDGEEGVATCLREHPDLVLMDVRMPKLTGLEASTQIKEALKMDSPVIIGLTGDLLNVKGTPQKHEVFDLVIGKPFEFTTLVKLVTNALQERTS